MKTNRLAVRVLALKIAILCLSLSLTSHCAWADSEDLVQIRGALFADDTPTSELGELLGV
jgi:hypothetical protein